MGLFDSVKNAFSGADASDIWQVVSDISQVDAIIEASKEKPQLIYKHSHRCSVCFVAKGTLEQASDEILQHADMYFLNVVKTRGASDDITSTLGVRHESPQVILIDDGEAVWHASHGSIDAQTILDQLE